MKILASLLPRFRLLSLFVASLICGLVIQLARQAPGMITDPNAVVAGVALLILGSVVGTILAPHPQPRGAVILLSILLFASVCYQWSQGFPDDLTMWALQFLSLGLLVGCLVGNRRLTASDAAADQTHEEMTSGH